MSKELGAWLRQQREDRNWTRPEVARRLVQAALAKGDTSLPGIDSLCHNIYRWERGADGLSERYKLCYCRAFGIPASHFGPGKPDGQGMTGPSPGTIMLATAPGLPAASSLPLAPYTTSALPDASLLHLATVAYRGMQASMTHGRTVQEEVLMAAHEGSESAERAEERGIGDTTLEQMRADLTRLARAYEVSEPFPVFLEMRRARNRMHDALDRRLWPRDTAELYLMIGCLNGLMASAANNLGYPESAEELVRAGWAYATLIDHRPLMAWLRLDAAYIAYWSGRPRQSSELAQSGLAYLSDGQNAAQLHLHQGLAAAATGDADNARQAITAARDARESEQRDELLEIGGEFGFSRAAQHYYAGFILSEIQQQTNDAITELERATERYAAEPEPGEHHSRRCQMLAHTDLATARLRAGALDAAIAALEPVLTIPVSERTTLQSQRLAVVRAELAHPIFHGSPQARDLDERIEEFGSDTITAGLHSLPGGPN
jgi:hypothetical protein